MTKRSIVKIKLNRKGIRALMRGPEAVADLRRRAENIQQEAGEGFESEAKPLRNRAHATVWTGTPEAREAEATNRTLTKSIDAGRRSS